MPKKEKCSFCEEKKELTYVTCEDADYCEHCLLEEFDVCYGCEEFVPNDLSLEQGGDCYCNDCFYERFAECENCSYIMDSDYVYYTVDGDAFCDDCYSEYYGWCQSCDSECHREYLYYQEGTDEDMCEQCYEAIEIDLDSYNSITIRDNPDNTFDKNKFKRLCGVELETVYKGEDVSDISDIGDTPFDFKRVSDGSINGIGAEWVSSPMNGDRLFNQIDGMSKWLKNNKFSTNRSCGYHVHIDARDLYWAELCGIGIVGNAAESIMYSMIPKSRKSSNWCRPSKVSTKQLLTVRNNDDFINAWYDGVSCGAPSLQKYHDSRYHAINMHSRAYLGTIEFRHHSGTLNTGKIKNWITICQSIVEAGIEIGNCIKEGKGHELIDISKERFLTKDEFVKYLNLKDIEGYIDSRLNKFIDTDSIYNNNYIYPNL